MMKEVHLGKVQILFLPPSERQSPNQQSEPLGQAVVAAVLAVVMPPHCTKGETFGEIRSGEGLGFVSPSET